MTTSGAGGIFCAEMLDAPFVPLAPADDAQHLVEARVQAARELYQGAVAAYLAARDEIERARLGDAMYYAQLATIEARFNPQGCAHFRALAEARLPGSAVAVTLRQAA